MCSSSSRRLLLLTPVTSLAVHVCDETRLQDLAGQHLHEHVKGERERLLAHGRKLGYAKRGVGRVGDGATGRTGQ